MGKLLLALACTLAAASAQAQIKCWNDAGGRRVCGDTPPPGAKVTTIAAPASPASQEPAAAKKGGPLTPAEREQAYRKRLADEQKASAKADTERKEAEAKADNCARARESVRTLEIGRVQRTDANGERYFLDDAQVAQELATARQSMQRWCN